MRVPSIRDIVDPACRDMDTELFYLSTDGVIYEEVLSVCTQCKSKQACLAYAEFHSEKYGIWGGKTPSKRGHAFNARKRSVLAEQKEIVESRNPAHAYEFARRKYTEIPAFRKLIDLQAMQEIVLESRDAQLIVDFGNNVEGADWGIIQEALIGT